MGRRRKDGNPLGLETRVYPHHGQFWYRHRDGRAEALGTDKDRANERARIYNDPAGRFGTIGYFLDLMIAEARAGRTLKPLAPRTVDDWEKSEAPALKVAFENLTPSQIATAPHLIAQYRDNRTAKVRANRELSLLSTLFTWIIVKGLCPGLKDNPSRLIRRNPEKAKERYVEDGEFRPVYGVAQRSVCMAMDLVYQTLQRPEDVLKAGPQDIRMKTVAGGAVRVLGVLQNKTKRQVDIEITSELDQALASLSGGAVAKFSRHLVHDLRGGRYTVDGIGAMLRRYCNTAGVKTFGLMDVRAKGATDMYLRGVSLERIQVLMGHKSVRTTEIYIKQLLRTVSVAQPNCA